MYSLDWPYIDTPPQSTAQFKQSPEDFQVDELFTGEFSGEGEHILLKIEKKGLNTEEVVKALARLINKPAKLISYAGLKDRQALTTQWLSVHAPGETIEGIGEINEPNWRVIASARHNKKLRPGFLSGNQFKIRLQAVSNPDDLIDRLERIKTTGVPNYFGEQRFGREAGNLVKAEGILVQGRKMKDRFLQGMYFSAARSWIYNLILASRVTDRAWNKALTGDVMQLAGTHSIFGCEIVTDEIMQRIQDKDISPASPLPGRGKAMVNGEALERIQSVYENWQPWIDGLSKHGLEEAWRANILHPEQLEYIVDGQTVELRFVLPAGAYATVVLRELVKYS